MAVDLNSMSAAMPKYLADLAQSSKNIEQIALYCKNAYQQENTKAETFQKTQQYIKDALSNVAYHVHTVGLNLTNFLQAQANELDKIDLQMQVVSDRVKTAYETVGTVAFRTNEAKRSYQPKSKMRKIEEPDLVPENARPIQKATRNQFNLKALDNVGTDLQGNKGKDNFIAALEAGVTIQSQTLTSSSSYSNFNNNSTRELPPPPKDFTPPALSAPSFMPPPPRDLNLPPPPVDLSLPPPPPPRDLGEYDLPPPPPM